MSALRKKVVGLAIGKATIKRHQNDESQFALAKQLKLEAILTATRHMYSAWVISPEFILRVSPSKSINEVATKMRKPFITRRISMIIYNILTRSSFEGRSTTPKKNVPNALNEVSSGNMLSKRSHLLGSLSVPFMPMTDAREPPNISC